MAYLLVVCGCTPSIAMQHYTNYPFGHSVTHPNMKCLTRLSTTVSTLAHTPCSSWARASDSFEHTRSRNSIFPPLITSLFRVRTIPSIPRRQWCVSSYFCSTCACDKQLVFIALPSQYCGVNCQHCASPHYVQSELRHYYYYYYYYYYKYNANLFWNINTRDGKYIQTE